VVGLSDARVSQGTRAAHRSHLRDRVARPSLRQLLIGSEGTLGVITELALRVRPAPRERVYEGAFFSDFEEGVYALRMLASEHAMPDVARLSDEQETRMSLALAGSGGAKGRLGRAYLGVRGYGGGCLAILGFEGEASEVSERRKRALAIVRSAGGLRAGRSPGQAWLASRFSAPYLRDELMTHGLLVETLETATQWSNLGSLHTKVGGAIAQALEGVWARGRPGIFEYVRAATSGSPPPVRSNTWAEPNAT